MVAWAIVPSVPKGPDINPAPDISSPGSFLSRIQNILGWAFAFALIIGVAMLIAAGIMYITSAGSARAGTAVKIMIAAIVGIAITGFAWAIINVVQGLFFSRTVDVSVGGA